MPSGGPSGRVSFGSRNYTPNDVGTNPTTLSSIIQPNKQ
nr:MAG TPA: hypothetical protein [Caudoviricetes sp.]